jgi:hypothetical protein
VTSLHAGDVALRAGDIAGWRRLVMSRSALVNPLRCDSTAVGCLVYPLRCGAVTAKARSLAKARSPLPCSEVTGIRGLGSPRMRGHSDSQVTGAKRRRHHHAIHRYASLRGRVYHPERPHQATADVISVAASPARSAASPVQRHSSLPASIFSSCTLRVSVLRPTPSRCAASMRRPPVCASARTISVFSNCRASSSMIAVSPRARR